MKLLLVFDFAGKCVSLRLKRQTYLPRDSISDCVHYLCLMRVHQPNVLLDIHDHTAFDGSGEDDLIDANSHFTEPLGRYVEEGGWRRQPEALQDFWNHLQTTSHWLKSLELGSLATAVRLLAYI